MSPQNDPTDTVVFFRVLEHTQINLKIRQLNAPVISHHGFRAGFSVQFASHTEYLVLAPLPLPTQL